MESGKGDYMGGEGKKEKKQKRMSASVAYVGFVWTWSTVAGDYSIDLSMSLIKTSACDPPHSEEGTLLAQG